MAELEATMNVRERVEWEVFFAEEGGDPERRADWRAGMLGALLANIASGFGGKKTSYAPKTFMLPRVDEEEQEMREIEAYQPTEEDVQGLWKIVHRLEAEQPKSNGHGM